MFTSLKKPSCRNHCVRSRYEVQFRAVCWRCFGNRPSSNVLSFSSLFSLLSFLFSLLLNYLYIRHVVLVWYRLEREIKLITMVLSDVSLAISSPFSSDLISTTPFQFVKAPEEEQDPEEAKVLLSYFYVFLRK